MAKDDVPKSADKGKGKAVADNKADETKKGKDAQVNGKKDDEKIVDCMTTQRVLTAYDHC